MARNAIHSSGNGMVESHLLPGLGYMAGGTGSGIMVRWFIFQVAFYARRSSNDRVVEVDIRPGYR